MKPLIVLVTTFIISFGAIYLINSQLDPFLSGKIAMSAMLTFTAIGHFTFTKGMVMMLPDFIPYKTTIVYATGVLEILAAIGLQIPTTSLCTGYGLILFFMVLLPGNIYAAIKHVDYQKASFDGPGPKYLWFRIPLQILFIAWTYFSVLYN